MLTALLATTLFASGCYYGHLASGQTRIWMASRSIDDVLEDPGTSPELRARLELVGEVRRFATTLGLDVGRQYTSYVDWPGDRIVTTVVATEARQVTPADFRFPIVGRVPYKGFFEPARADAEAAEQRRAGRDVCLVAVPAYSTLGWLNDPVTAPMLRRSDGELVETVLHELVHANVFVESQPDFNEGAANFFGEEASIRFYAGRDAEAETLRREQVEDARLLDAALNELRAEIAVLYSTPERDPSERADLERRARDRIRELSFRRRDADLIADQLRLNDACLALQGTYAGDVRRHAEVLDAEGGELDAYLERLRSASKSADPRASFFAP